MLFRSDATLVDMVLGGGFKQGYMFDCQPSSTTPDYLWMAYATPLQPGQTGDRYFVTNHAGVIFYSRTHSFTLNNACTIPADAIPVGR